MLYCNNPKLSDGYRRASSADSYQTAPTGLWEQFDQVLHCLQFSLPYEAFLCGKIFLFEFESVVVNFYGVRKFWKIAVKLDCHFD